MDLTPTERDTLLAILLVGDRLPVEIAEAAGRHPKSVSRSVPSLVDLGLVVQAKSIPVLTPKGYAEARRILREETSRIQRRNQRE